MDWIMAYPVVIREPVLLSNEFLEYSNRDSRRTLEIASVIGLYQKNQEKTIVIKNAKLSSASPANSNISSRVVASSEGGG